MARRNRRNARRNTRSRQKPQDTFSVTGIVEEIEEHQFGRSTLYQVFIEGEDDSFGFGRELEGADEGVEITFEAYENDKGYLTKVDDTVEVVAGGSERSPSRRSGRDRSQGSGASKGRSGGRTGGSSGKSDRDSKRRSKESIQYAEALSTATQVLNFQVAEGMVNLGAKNKAKERLEAYWGMLDQYVAMFYEEIETQAGLSRADDAVSGGEDEPADAGDPDREYDD